MAQSGAGPGQRKRRATPFEQDQLQVPDRRSRANDYRPLSADEKRLYDGLAGMDTTAAAHLIDQIVLRKRSPTLVRTLSTYMTNRLKDDRKKQQPQHVQHCSPRHELIRQAPANLSDFDWDKMPVVINSHNVPAFLAADAEFTTDVSGKDPQLLVIMFSAVKIPLNGGTPVPVFHTLVNHELDGKKFVSNHFEVNYCHGIKRGDYKWHISTSTFVKSLTAFMEKSYLCFWDSVQDTKALRQTFRRAGQEAAFEELEHRIVDLQKPLQEIIRKPLNELDQGVKRHDQNISLENAVRALLYMKDELQLSPAKTAYVQKIADAIHKARGEEKDPEAKSIKQRIKKGTAKKNSVVDANAVAVLYNYLHPYLKQDIESLAHKNKK
jgi:hypothetical protein